MRKITLETTLFLKVNTGNFESFDVSKSVKEEIEFDKPEELVEKSKRHDNMVALLIKNEAEGMIEKLGRKRIMKISGQDTPVPLWESGAK